MKISELIKELKNAKKRMGDVEVVIYEYNLPFSVIITSESKGEFSHFYSKQGARYGEIIRHSGPYVLIEGPYSEELFYHYHYRLKKAMDDKLDRDVKE